MEENMFSVEMLEVLEGGIIRISQQQVIKKTSFINFLHFTWSIQFTALHNPPLFEQLKKVLVSQIML